MHHDSTFHLSFLLVLFLLPFLHRPIFHFTCIIANYWYQLEGRDDEDEVRATGVVNYLKFNSANLFLVLLI